MGLRWRDLDLPEAKLVLHDTKNGETRVVPLARSAREALRKHGALRRLDTDLVFPGRRQPDGTYRPANITGAWKRALQVAEIEDFRFHDLRHTTASYLAMNKATMREIADVLGHKTMAMAQRYSHLSEAHNKAVVESMADRFL